MGIQVKNKTDMGKLIRVLTCSVLLVISFFTEKGMAQGPALNEEQQIRSRFIEACTEYMREEYDKAEVIFLEILEKDEKNAASLYYLSKIYAGKEQNSQALSFIQKATQVDLESKVYQTFRRDLLLTMGSIEQAIKVQQELTNRFPQDLALHMKELSLYTESQLWAEAKDKIEYIQANFEGSTFLNEKNIQVLSALGEQELAKSQLEKLIQEDPGNPRYIEMLKDLYPQEGAGQESISLLNEVLQKDGENSQALWLLSIQYWEMGDTSRFDSHILPAFADPGTPLPEKLAVLKKQKSPENSAFSPAQMTKLVQAITEAHQGESGSIRLKGDMFYMAQAYDSAFATYKSVLELDPSDIQVWENLLSSAEKSGQNENLFWEAEEAISYFPNSPSLLGYYGMGAVRLSKWDQAQYAFTKIEKLPDIPPKDQAAYLLEWAKMDYLRDQHESALGRIVNSQALYPRAIGYELHGDILLKLGREQEAMEQWKLAIQNGAENLNIQEKLTQ